VLFPQAGRCLGWTLSFDAAFDCFFHGNHDRIGNADARSDTKGSVPAEGEMTP